MSDIEQLIEPFMNFFPIIIIVFVLALVFVLNTTKPTPEEIAKAEEERKARMQTVTVEDVKVVEDTVRKSNSGTGLVMMNGHIGIGRTSGGYRNEVVIKRYVYLRDKENRLMQFSVSEANNYAAISHLKGREITVEMLPNCCIWQNRIKLKDKLVLESSPMLTPDTNQTYTI